MDEVKFVSRKTMIEGCPEAGIDAVEWREAAGLPSAPTNQIEVEISDVRGVTRDPRVRHLLSESADLYVELAVRDEWQNLVRIVPLALDVDTVRGVLARDPEDIVRAILLATPQIKTERELYQMELEQYKQRRIEEEENERLEREQNKKRRHEEEAIEAAKEKIQQQLGSEMAELALAGDPMLSQQYREGLLEPTVRDQQIRDYLFSTYRAKYRGIRSEDLVVDPGDEEDDCTRWMGSHDLRVVTAEFGEGHTLGTMDPCPTPTQYAQFQAHRKLAAEYVMPPLPAGATGTLTVVGRLHRAFCVREGCEATARRLGVRWEFRITRDNAELFYSRELAGEQ